MLTSIKQFCDTYKLLKPHMKVILGLSGGPDSVFLLHMLVQLREHYAGLEIIVAHLDHGWRVESAQEALFCKQLAEKFGLTFIAKHAQEISSNKKAQSKEDLGRILRRTLFEEIARQYHADAIALGQHADDQQETFFIRLIRGTGLSGLASIRPKHGLYIRPLLNTHKEAILDYLHQHEIPYQVDASNSSPDFLRNRIRQEITPTIKALDSRFTKNFEKTITHLQETDAYLEKHTIDLLKSITKITDVGLELDIAGLMKIDQFMHQKLILAWLISYKIAFPVNAQFFQQLSNFLQKPDPGTYCLQQHQIIKQKKKAIIRPLNY